MDKINLKPLSVNNCWRGRRFKTVEYEVYEAQLLNKLKPLQIPQGKIQLDVTFYVSSKASDTDNLLKPFIDILQKKYLFDDKMIYKINAEKIDVNKGEEGINFMLSTINIL